MIQGWFYLLYAIFLIKTHSLEQLKRVLTDRKSKCKSDLSIEEAERVFTLIRQSKRFFLSRTACLEQSLAIFLLSVSQGKAVDWCVGVKVAPFSSHAWVEVKGIPVKEPEEISRYKKVLVI